MGNYNDFTYELSEHDYKVIAAGSTGVFENNATNFDWKYTINHTCNFDREQNFTKILHEKTTADRLI